MLRFIGGFLVLVGFIMLLTIVMAIPGIVLMVLGLLFMIAGGKRTIVVHVQNGNEQTKR